MRLATGDAWAVRPDGSRVLRLYLGTDKVTGRAIRPQLTIGPDVPEDEARRAAARWEARQRAAAGVGTTTRVGDLMAVFLDGLVAVHGSRHTLDAYRRCVAYSAPLADSDVNEVTAGEVSSLYLGMLGDGYSRATVELLSSFLKGFWRRMRELGIADADPTSAARLPRGRVPVEARALDGDQARALARSLEAAMDERVRGRRGETRRAFAFGSWLALSTGMRCGEVCGLRRADFLGGESPSLRVCGTADKTRRREEGTKGRRSRSVALTRPMADRVEWYMDWAARRYGGGRYGPLVTADGGFANASSMATWLKRHARGMGLPDWVRFHTLRHTHATQLLAGGMDPKTVSERLGHADVATTLRYYGHVLPGRDGEAAARFEEIVGDGQ
ncbi:MAG: site-specific integrase [Olsenella uli]|uniref:tyrosine-type recombinase/integrase n=1 Tax=Olsenella uli TaxID=133926 RepID=UPI001D976AA2|nr:site-specific integrase [Olsenella uli]MBS6418854.1 site-specific integrase [Olsenella uli]